ncbi:1483_t:CDS:2 [Entrophospora sp. SA101]|nr:1478_t:CDS:2 [Entrophospora sp. SA101]CAJ0917358.1 1483_t:CDS:2 [Entrophospora sp. SA101]
MFVKALYDYDSTEISGLSFKRNDIIQVINQLDSGWWDGICNGIRGWFPSNYITMVNDKEGLYHLSVNQQIKTILEESVLEEELKPQLSNIWVLKHSSSDNNINGNNDNNDNDRNIYSTIGEEDESVRPFENEEQNLSENFEIKEKVGEELRWNHSNSSSTTNYTLTSNIRKTTSLSSLHHNKQQYEHYEQCDRNDDINNNQSYSNSIDPNNNIINNQLLLQNPDNEHFTWDSLLNNVIYSINQLTASANDTNKHEFTQNIDTVNRSIRIMLYASDTINRDSIIFKTFPRLSKFHNDVTSSLFKLILLAKIASNEWSPPGSTDRMIQECKSLLDATKQFVNISKDLIVIKRVDPKIPSSSNYGSNNNYAWNHNSDSNLNTSVITDHFRSKKILLSSSLTVFIMHVHKIVSQVGQFLALIKNINISKLNETSNNSIQEFEIARQSLYNNVASIAILTQFATKINGINDNNINKTIDQLLFANLELDKSVKNLCLAVKFLIEEKENQDDSRKLLLLKKKNVEINEKENDDNINNLARSTTKATPPKPWFLCYDYDISEMCFNADNLVIGGTLKALVERLTMHDLLDSNFIATFLLTFRSFCTADELFDLLVERFIISLPEDREISREEFEIWTEKKQMPIRIRVFNILKSWLESYYIYEQDKHCLERMKEFASTTMNLYMTNAATSLLKVIERRQQQPHVATFKELIQTFSAPPPPPILPRSLKRVKFLYLDPLEIARQFTIIQSKLYNKIRPVECLDKAWSKEEGGDLAVNIKAMILNSNQTIIWVQKMILSQSEVRKRCSIIKHFIYIADKCKQLNNFNTLMSIVSGLNSSPIYRLRRTWETVPARHIQTFEMLKKIMNASKNFSEYREMLHRINPPCVPFLGVYLTDLTFIEDGNQNTLKKQKNLINFSKRMKTAEVIREIQQYQVPYNLSPVHEIQLFLTSHIEDSNDSSDFYDKSLAIEPKEREDEKIARLLQESGFL